MTFASPVVVKKEDETKKLMEELGIDGGISDGALDTQDVVPPTSDEQVPLDDLELQLNPSSARTETNVPPKCDATLPTLEKSTDNQNLLCDFASDVNPSASCSEVVSPPLVDVSPPTSEKNSDVQSLLDDFGFATSPVAPCSDNDQFSVQNSSPLTSETNCNAQNLLDDFGFESKPVVSEESKSTLSISPLALEGSSTAHDLLDDFGFDINSTSSAKKEQLTHQNSSTMNIRNDFGFDLNVASGTEKEPAQPVKNTSSSEQNPSTQNLLDDFGFDTRPPTSSTDIVIPSSCDPPLPTPEHNVDAHSLMDDFGFDVSPPTTSVGQEPQICPLTSASSQSDNLLEDFGFSTDTQAPPTIDGLTKSQTVDNLLTPLSSSEQKNDVTASLLDDFGFAITSSASCPNVGQQPKTDSGADKASSGGKPVKRDLPLIAFSDDVVLMWKKDGASPEKEEHTSQDSLEGKESNLAQPPSDEAQPGPSTEPEKLNDTVVIPDTVTRPTEVIQVAIDGEGREDRKDEKEKKTKSRLPAPSQQLKKCCSFLRSPVKCSQLEELKEQINSTFTKCDVLCHSDSGSTCESPCDDGDHEAQICSADKKLTVLQPSGVDVVQPRSGSQSLNSSFSSEHSQASSIASSLSTASRESSKDVKGARKVGRKIPKPDSKNKPCIKPSLLPSKSAVGTSKASGAVSKLNPPNSRFVKPKSTSVKSSFVKPPAKKTTAPVPPSRPTSSKGTRPSKTVTKASDTSDQHSLQRFKSQLPRSKLAAPTAVRKKAVDTENAKRVPLTCSTPITTREASESPSKTSPKPSSGGGAANDTFTLSDATSTATDKPPCTPRTRKEGRRSLIPTPAQENRVLRAKRARDTTAFGEGDLPRSRVFKPRNGLGRSYSIKPLKSKGYTFGTGVMEDIPSFGAAKVSKVVHSPIDKENRPATPHSKWSPIRRKKPLNLEDACIQCTKKVKAII